MEMAEAATFSDPLHRPPPPLLYYPYKFIFAALASVTKSDPSRRHACSGQISEFRVFFFSLVFFLSLLSCFVPVLPEIKHGVPNQSLAISTRDTQTPSLLLVSWMADCPVTAAWAASFCLGCDANSQADKDYCSKECFLRDRRLSYPNTSHRVRGPETSLPIRLLSRLGSVTGQTVPQQQQLAVSPAATPTRLGRVESDQPLSGVVGTRENHWLSCADTVREEMSSVQTCRVCEQDACWAGLATKTSRQPVPQEQRGLLCRTSNYTSGEGGGAKTMLIKGGQPCYDAVSRLYDVPMASETRHGPAMQWDMWRQTRTSMALELDDLAVFLTSDNSSR